MVRVCRTCLEHIQTPNFTRLNNSAESVQVKNELSVCVPELAIDLVANPVLCMTCVTALHAAYTFKNRCLKSEKCILNYMQNITKNVSIETLCANINQPSQPSIKEQTNNTSEELVLSKPREELPSTITTKQDLVTDLNNLLDGVLGDIRKQSSSDTKKNSDEDRNCIDIEELSSDEDIENNHADETTKSNKNMENNTNGKSATQHCHVELTRLSSKHLKTSAKHVLKIVPDKTTNNSSNRKLHSCKLCDFNTFSYQALYRHKKKHLLDQLFTCRLCKYSTTFKANYKRHKNSHLRASFNCDQCSFTTFVSKRLTQHQEIHYKKVNENKRKNCDLIDEFACSTCTYTTDQERYLIDHFKVHKERIFRCTQCEFKSVWKGSVKIHMKLHTGKKPFRCNICEYRSATKGALKTHSRRHTGEKPFSCTVCQKNCFSKKALIIHLKKYHGYDK